MAVKSTANGNQMIRFTCLPSYLRRGMLNHGACHSVLQGRDFLDRWVGQPEAVFALGAAKALRDVGTREIAAQALRQLAKRYGAALPRSA
jgi:hypothetical protein